MGTHKNGREQNSVRIQLHGIKCTLQADLSARSLSWRTHSPVSAGSPFVPFSPSGHQVYSPHLVTLLRPPSTPLFKIWSFACALPQASPALTSFLSYFDSDLTLGFLVWSLNSYLLGLHLWTPITHFTWDTLLHCCPRVCLLLVQCRPLVLASRKGLACTPG